MKGRKREKKEKKKGRGSFEMKSLKNRNKSIVIRIIFGKEIKIFGKIGIIFGKEKFIGKEIKGDRYKILENKCFGPSKITGYSLRKVLNKGVINSTNLDIY